MGETLAAIDVGTNSIHLVIARLLDGDGFEVVASEKEMVRLGTGSTDMKHLDPAAIDRGIAALARYKRMADIDGAPVRAVATSAVREALNHHEFLDRARTEAGVEVEVVSGVEEARLIHLGVLQALPVFDERLLLCDIGGGSTEIVIGQRGDVLAARSLKLGAVRLTHRFFPGEHLHPGAVSACRAHVRSMLAPFERVFTALGFEVAAGSSGTIQAVAQMAHVAAGGEPLRTYNAFRLSTRDVRKVGKRLAKATTVRERAKIPGLDAARADIILAGALILEGVCTTFGIDELLVSDYALREGVLLDTIERTVGGSLHHLRDVSRRSILQLAGMFDDDLTHDHHVAALALQLFDATAGLHGFDEGCREYLEAAALLANVGLRISHSQHHRHSYYVIRHSDVLTGLTDTEIEMIALVARYHRKSAPKESHPEFARLTTDDQRVVRTLAGLLRVAIGLDRSHDQRVRQATVSRRDDELVIGVVSREAADLELELYVANERKALLEQVLGLPIVVEQVEAMGRGDATGARAAS